MFLFEILIWIRKG